MARTFGAQIFYSAANLGLPLANQAASAGNYAWTFDANGVLVLTNTAGAATVKFVLSLAEAKRPYITFPAFPGQGTVLTTNEFQEAYGSTPASAGAPGPGNAFSGVAAGNPAVVNPNMTTQFGTPNVPVGIALIDVFAVYAVTTAALTGATIQVNRARFGENLAYTLDTPLAATAIATTTTTSITTPHVQKVSLAQPLIFETADFSDTFVTLSINAAATSLVSIYGIGIHAAVCWE